MDAKHFGILTRLLHVRTRRRVLGLFPAFGAATLAAALGLNRPHPAAAKCKKKCGLCKRCKKGKCKPKPAGTTCTGGTCQGGTCVPATAPSPPPSVPACGAGGPCLVFLSSMTYTGNLGGLSGADAKCQDLADAAGLPGTYKPWLSDASSSPSSRFVRSSGPYHLVTGTTIAASYSALTNGAPLAPINVTETGGGIGATNATWTNTRLDGTGSPFGNDCENWSTETDPLALGAIGNAEQSNSFWTSGGESACNPRRHLYCFQQR